MASKRDIKRNVNNMVFDIVDECFSIQLWDESKTEKADAIIDEAADFQDAILSKINQAKSKGDFKVISKEIEEAAIEFVHKLNSLN
jgi:hypothetical protein